MIKNIVIIDGKSYSKGGTAQVAVSSAIELANRGYSVIYIAADGFDSKALLQVGIKVVNLDQCELKENPNRIMAAVNGIWNIKVLKRVSNVLSEMPKESTIVHIHGYLHRFSPSILKACTDSGIKTVLTLHDYFIICPCGGFYNYSERKICTIKAMSVRCILCNCDKRSYFHKVWRVFRQLVINRYCRYNSKLNLIYISDFSFSKIRKEIQPFHRLFYVRNPYDTGNGVMYKAETNNKYVYLGRISSEKGVEVFCEAFSQLKCQNRIVGDAVVVGDGDQREKLSKIYPEIEFTGWKNHDEIGEVIKYTRALVFPSKWYEGSPLTPIEFMSYGIPCIISDVCSAVEYIEKDVNGIIFRSEDIQDLKEKLSFADDNAKWEKISCNLRASFKREEYSLEKHVDRLLAVYEIILADA